MVRYEAWRRHENPDWRPVDEELIDVIERVVSRFESFEHIPARLLGVEGKHAPVKRLLVKVRSKIFRVYVGRGRRRGQISIRRVRHPARKPIEQKDHT